MNITRWGVYNSDNKQIDTVTTSYNNRQAAAKKVLFKYGKLSSFLYIRKL